MAPAHRSILPSWHSSRFVLWNEGNHPFDFHPQIKVSEADGQFSTTKRKLSFGPHREAPMTSPDQTTQSVQIEDAEGLSGLQAYLKTQKSIPVQKIATSSGQRAFTT